MVAPSVVVVDPSVVVVVAPVVVVVAPDVVVVAPAVVVVAPDVVVVAPPVVVVVEVGRVSVPKRMIPTARSPLMSPIASTQVAPAACWAGVGGHGYSAASVAALPLVVQPVMTDVEGTVWVHVGVVPGTGGPVVPALRTWVPVRVPFVAPLLGTVTSARGVQLTGRSLPR